MKITVENPNASFGDLKMGETFWPVGTWYEKDEIFMVIERDYSLGAGETYDGYAINLKTGELYGFNNDENIIKYDLNITAKPAA